MVAFLMFSMLERRFGITNGVVGWRLVDSDVGWLRLWRWGFSKYAFLFPNFVGFTDIGVGLRPGAGAC